MRFSNSLKPMDPHGILRDITAPALMATAFAGDPPAFPNQPTIHLALRKLTEAQEHLVAGEVRPTSAPT